MNEHYLGNPNLKKANTPIEFTAEDVKEFQKCENDPVYFITKYITLFVNYQDNLVSQQLS
jgi:hypothetical protein